MKDVTLVAIDFLWHDLTGYAIQRSLEQIDAKEVLIISDKEILKGAKHVMRPPVANMAEYANIMLKGVAEHVNTKHALFVQWDGIANDKAQWTDEFLDYDYIGAVWPWRQEGQNVGNGGFSLRSKKLLDECMHDSVQLTEEEPIAEDNIIGIHKRTYLESKGIKFAPTKLARQFSFETGLHESSFGFHGLWNVFNLMDDAAIEYFLPRINYAGWNEHKWVHVLAALFRKENKDQFHAVFDKLIKNSPQLMQQVLTRLDQSVENNKQHGLIIL